MDKYCLQYGITQHHLELLLEYSKSHNYLPDSLQITLQNDITNGLVYEICQRCKHHGKLVTIQMILCLLNKKYDKLLLLSTRVSRLVTKISKLRGAAKSAYCDEVVNFLDIMKGRDDYDQIVNIPEDEAQILYQVHLNITNIVMELCVRDRGIAWNIQGGNILGGMGLVVGVGVINSSAIEHIVNVCLMSHLRFNF